MPSTVLIIISAKKIWRKICSSFFSAHSGTTTAVKFKQKIQPFAFFTFKDTWDKQRPDLSIAQPVFLNGLQIIF